MSFSFPFSAKTHTGFALTLKELQHPNLNVPLEAIKKLILSAILVALHPVF